MQFEVSCPAVKTSYEEREEEGGAGLNKRSFFYVANSMEHPHSRLQRTEKVLCAGGGRFEKSYVSPEVNSNYTKQ